MTPEGVMYEALRENNGDGEKLMAALKQDLHNAGMRGDMLGQIQVRSAMTALEGAIEQWNKNHAEA